MGVKKSVFIEQLFQDYGAFNYITKNALQRRK